jgi:hypothetical protein
MNSRPPSSCCCRMVSGVGGISAFPAGYRGHPLSTSRPRRHAGSGQSLSVGIGLTFILSANQHCCFGALLPAARLAVSGLAASGMNCMFTGSAHWSTPAHRCLPALKYMLTIKHYSIRGGWNGSMPQLTRPYHIPGQDSTFAAFAEGGGFP